MLIIVAVPVALALLLLVLRREPPRPGPGAPSPAVTPAASAAPAPALPSSTSPMKGKRADFVPLETWPDGSPRVLAREWTEDGLAHEEHCFYSASGEELGCGIRRDGAAWEGTFVAWHVPISGSGELAAKLKEMTSWRQGRKHGISRTYNLDGAPLIELVFEDGALLERRILAQRENQLLELGTRKTDLPASRRTRNTGL
ncbi:MAG: hypothetical protein ACOX6T_19435 [Myxococcales bacterium]